MNLPEDVCNQALDAAAVDLVIGDLQEGTREAQVLLRAYQQCLLQLLRSANWNFTRKRATLQLLGDATGNTPNVGTAVVKPWVYEYALPPDCVKARFVPANVWPPNNLQVPGNISIPTTPIMTGLPNPQINRPQDVPAKFLVATDFNYPVEIVPNTEWWETPGISPEGRTVVLTNVYCADLVYTAYMRYPNVWDALFRAAFVSYLASEIVLPLAKDKKFGLVLRDKLVASVVEKLKQARIRDGDEGMPSANLSVDWMRTRTGGGGWGGTPWWGWGNSPGVFGYGWDMLSCSDGNTY